jgi:peptidoglycan hydrolase-like protein with peptidoglycan-binding domain
MKKTLIIFIFLSVLAVAGAAAAQSEKAISLGSRSDEVKSIQEVLKTDKSIYPEGLVTGYFGQATKKAVARVQAKCGLSQTGIVDDDTEKCIFPVDYKITVVSPNGGETWDRGQIQNIQWKAVLPITLSPNEKIMPFWPKASIDLFKKQDVVCIQAPCTAVSVFVKHLAMANLFDGSYSWKISGDISNGSDYVVRVSTGQRILPLYRYEKEGGSLPMTEIWPGPAVGWDESDNVFAISGKIVPPGNDLSQVIKMLQEMADQLAKVIQLLKELNQIN